MEQEVAPIEPWNAQAGGRLLGAVLFLPAAAFVFAWSLFALLFAVLLPRVIPRHRGWMSRMWARGVLVPLGVKPVVSGREHLQTDGPLVVLFNHQSLLDLFLISSLWSNRTTVIYKQEFHGVPILGRALRAFDFIPVDRSKPESARKSLREAAEQVREKNAVIFIAPEGTRSRTGRLGTFKNGPFHLAAMTGAPVVPLVLRGVWDLLPVGRLIPRRGRVGMEILPPIDTSDWHPEHSRDYAEQLRRVYLRYLPGVEAEEPA